MRRTARFFNGALFQFKKCIRINAVEDMTKTTRDAETNIARINRPMREHLWEEFTTPCVSEARTKRHSTVRLRKLNHLAGVLVEQLGRFAGLEDVSGAVPGAFCGNRTKLGESSPPELFDRSGPECCMTAAHPVRNNIRNTQTEKQSVIVRTVRSLAVFSAHKESERTELSSDFFSKKLPVAVDERAMRRQMLIVVSERKKPILRME